MVNYQFSQFFRFHTGKMLPCAKAAEGLAHSLLLELRAFEGGRECLGRLVPEEIPGEGYVRDHPAVRGDTHLDSAAGQPGLAGKSGFA